MTIAGHFIAEIQSEPRSGTVSSETEQHPKHEFRSLAPNAMGAAFATAIGSTATLKRIAIDFWLLTMI